MNGFPQRLRELRERQNKKRSRRTTSELCGLHPDDFRRYERGEGKPDVESLEAIADYFDVTVDYLLGRTEK